MSFIGGLAASPDPSNDVVFDHVQEDQDPHQLLLKDAWHAVHHFDESRNSTDLEDESQQVYSSFDFSHRDLYSLPAELASIISEHAVRLALNHNNLTGLSDLGPCMGDFTTLNYLVLKNNQIQEFPRDILLCTSLETLDLHANVLQSLPDDFSRLKNLKKLAIDRNKLLRIPSCIAYMKHLNWINTSNNPIVWPEKSKWKISNRNSEESSRGPNWDRVMEETRGLKRALLQLERSERSPETDHNETPTDTPKPARKRVAGRFPVRPSLSGVDIEAAANGSTGSPGASRPALKPSKTTAYVPQTTRAPIIRPGVEPLINGDRHRSNSESQMATSRRLKRMGLQVSRSGNSSGEMSLESSIDLTQDRTSHARGISAGSLLYQAMQGYAVADSSGAESPAPTDLSRSVSVYEGQSRLSSLPEARRKSHYNSPVVEVAETIVYTVDQVQGPLQKLVNATKQTGSRQRSLARAAFAAFANKSDLAQALQGLESQEDEDLNKRDSMGSLNDRCERAMSSFQSLLEMLQAHITSVLERSRPRDARMLMHMTFAAIVEVKDIATRLGDTVGLNDDDDGEQQHCVPEVPHPQPVRELSPAPRPITSLRVKDPKRVTHHHHQSSNLNKPLPSPRSVRSTSGSTFSSRLQGYASATSRAQDYGPPTPSLTHSNSVASSFSTEPPEPSIDDDEDRIFQKTFDSLVRANRSVTKGLDHCRKIFIKLRQQQYGLGSSAYDVDNFFQDVIQHCDYGLGVSSQLKDRLRSFQTQDRNKFEFWQACTEFIKAWSLFATVVKNAQSPSATPTELVTLLKPIHRDVKEASECIAASPWRELAVHGPSSATFSPAVNGSLPFSMSNPNPPPMPPPAKDLPARPVYQSQNQSGLGLQTPWGSTTSLNGFATHTSNTGTLRAVPTTHSRENGTHSTTPTPTAGNLSRASSRAGNYSNPAPKPASTASHSSYVADSTPTDTAVPNSARPPLLDSRYNNQSLYESRYNSRYAPNLPEISPYGSGSGTRSGQSSGYATPLPTTPMSAALGPAAKATMSMETNTGTMKKTSGYTDIANGQHSHQNSFDNVVSNGYSSSSISKGSNWYGDLGSGPGAAIPAARAIKEGRPALIERSVSAAGYYPSGSRIGSIRQVSRSASQRR